MRNNISRAKDMLEVVAKLASDLGHDSDARMIYMALAMISLCGGIESLSVTHGPQKTHYEMSVGEDFIRLKILILNKKIAQEVKRALNLSTRGMV